MGDKKVSYRECLGIHANLGEKSDGCQGFKPSVLKRGVTTNCNACGYHGNFHRKVAQRCFKPLTRVVHTECQKIHHLEGGSTYKDGCKAFVERAPTCAVGDKCVACGCRKSFHIEVS